MRLVNLTDLPIIRFPPDSAVFKFNDKVLFPGYRSLAVKNGDIKAVINASFVVKTYLANIENFGLLLDSEQSRLLSNIDDPFILSNPTAFSSVVFTSTDRHHLDPVFQNAMTRTGINNDSLQMARNFLLLNPEIPKAGYVHVKNGTGIKYVERNNRLINRLLKRITK